MDLSDITAPEWVADALCAQVDPELFFPGKGESPRDAKRICACCEVRAQCLEYALAHGQRYGVWGGVSERGRGRLAHDRSAEVAA